MNRISTRVVGRHIGLGMALLSAVTLLTLLFSFLGTIACGALVGMTFGARRQWEWQGLLASLVFPAVITGFVYFQKPNLTSQQCLVLPIICFGTFGVTYLLTHAAFHFERQNGSSAAEQPVLTENSEPQLATGARIEGSFAAMSFGRSPDTFR
jgi:ABC-type uncharacterized transport system permease subunit